MIYAASAQSQYRPGGGSSGGAGGFGGSGGGFGGSSGGGVDGSEGGFDDAAGGSGGSLEEAIPGVPGEDYPILAEVPETSFLCDGQADGGYYADPEAECQAFHICANDGNGGLTKYSFLCPNGTLFQQQYFVCDWWFNVDCSLAEQLYSINDENAAERAANSPEGAGGGGQYQGGAAGAAGGRGGSGGRGGGSRKGGSGGSQGSASSPRGSYSSPSGGSGSQGGAISARGSYSGPSGDNQGFGGSQGFGDEGFGADTGYGAPGAGGFGGNSLSGYSRRNARELSPDASNFQVETIQGFEYDL